MKEKCKCGECIECSARAHAKTVDRDAAIYRTAWIIQDHNLISAYDLDDLLESLQTKGLLSDKGEQFREDFHEAFIKTTL